MSWAALPWTEELSSKFCHVAQVHGAASDALASAAAAVKAELASKALPAGKAAAAPPPSPVLTQLLLTAAKWLVAAARLSAARMAMLLEDPCLAPYRVRK